MRNIRKTSITKTRKPTKSNKTSSKPYVDPYEDDDDDEIDESMLPNESMPGYMDVTDANDSNFHFNYGAAVVTGVVADAVMKGNRVMKIRATSKNRPSLLDYYGESLASSSSSNNKKNSQKLNEHDIDETFDFLDEELKKY